MWQNGKTSVGRNQPHLRGHNYTLVKPRCVSSVRRSFFSTRVINMWNNLPADTTDFSSLRKFCASVSKDYLLTFGTVYFMWCTHGFNVPVQHVLYVVCISILITVLATCKWLLALCCLINLNLNLKCKPSSSEMQTRVSRVQTSPKQPMPRRHTWTWSWTRVHILRAWWLWLDLKIFC